MQDIPTKSDGTTSLPAAEWNQIPDELENAIKSTGITLSIGDLFQLAKTIANYAGDGDFYTDSGSADAYALSTIGSKQSPTGYNNGLRVRFVVGNTNTGASTVNVATLGVKNIFYRGAVLTAGMLTLGDIVTLSYDTAAGRFNLVVGDSLFVDKFSAEDVRGVKTFLSSLTKLRGAVPELLWEETGVTADNGKWGMVAAGESLILRLRDDALSTFTNIFSVARTDMVVDLFNVLATNLQHNGNDVITDADSASTTAEGIVERATNAEAQAMTDTTRYITPAHLGLVIPSVAFLVNRNNVAQDNITGADLVEWTNEEFDTNNDFDNVTNFDFTPSVAGKYLLSVAILWQNTVSGDRVIVQIRKNGVAVASYSLTISDTISQTTAITTIQDANGTTDNFDVVANNIGRNTSDLDGTSGSTFFTGSRIA